MKKIIKNFFKKMSEKKSEKNSTSKKTSDNGSGNALLVIIIVLLIFIILGASAWLGFKYWQKKTEEIKKDYQIQMQKEVKEKPETEEKISDNKNSNSPIVSEKQSYFYENKDFGFRLNFSSSWKDFKTRTQKQGGDFEVSRTCFFLPITEGESSVEMPGYFNPFCISAYVADSWDEAQKAGDTAVSLAGEEVGRNSLYAFVFSHFNGDAPAEISQKISDMQQIAESIDVFEPKNEESSFNENPTSEAGVVSGDSNFSDPSPGQREKVDPDFQMSGVYYWNCKNRYALTYPTAWSNNGMTFDSDTVILKGNKIQLWIEKKIIGSAETLQDFAEKESAKIGGNAVWVENINWQNNTTVFRVTFRNPDAMALFWIAGDYGMALKAFGPGYNGEYDNIQKTIATLATNSSHPSCKK